MQTTQLHSEAVAATRKPSFRQWPHLIALGNNQISTSTSAAGNGWVDLIQKMPQAGTLLKSSRVLTLTPRDRERCAVVWHLRMITTGTCRQCSGRSSAPACSSLTTMLGLLANPLSNRIVAPQFALEHHLPKPADFNDLLRLASIDDAKTQLRQVWSVEP